jgi:hypothetical protein
MRDLQRHDEPGPEPMSAGARYRAHLARFPERDGAPRPRRSAGRWWRELLRALRLLAWWSVRRRRRV